MLVQFTLRLVTGISLTWLFLPREAITAGFFRIQMLLVMGLSVLAGLSFPLLVERVGEGMLVTVLQGRMLCGTLAVLAFIGSIFWTLVRRRAGALFIYLIACLSTATLIVSTLGIETATLNQIRSRTEVELTEVSAAPKLSHSSDVVRRKELVCASEMATSLVIGSFVTAMLLGHWYLTAPMMTLTPLQRSNTIAQVALLVRLLLSGFVLYAGFEFLSQSSLSTSHLSWLVLRWIAGIIIPLIACLLVRSILKYNNTQSATGVLFTGVILTFIGELMGTLLFWESGIPF